MLGATCVGKLREAGIRVHEPEGGFYLFLDFEPLREPLARRGITDAKTLCERLLDEAGVAILPGSVFERPANELSARLAYVNFDGAKALSASEKVPLDAELPASFVDSWCADVDTAMQNIVDWCSRPA